MRAAGITLVTFSPAALAYLDPATGSMIISAIVGIVATIGLALKTFWYRLRALARRVFGRGRGGRAGGGRA